MEALDNFDFSLYKNSYFLTDKKERPRKISCLKVISNMEVMQRVMNQLYSEEQDILLIIDNSIWSSYDYYSVQSLSSRVKRLMVILPICEVLKRIKAEVVEVSCLPRINIFKYYK